MVNEGDMFKSVCCEGYDWEVAYIFDDKNPDDRSIWGVCQNDNCDNYQKSIGFNDPYRGVSSICQGDLLELVEDELVKVL